MLRIDHTIYVIKNRRVLLWLVLLWLHHTFLIYLSDIFTPILGRFIVTGAIVWFKVAVEFVYEGYEYNSSITYYIKDNKEKLHVIVTLVRRTSYAVLLSIKRALMTVNRVRSRDGGCLINPWRAGSESIRFNIVNIMVVDVLAPCVARASAPMIITV